jgi:hypothetical protein
MTAHFEYRRAVLGDNGPQAYRNTGARMVKAIWHCLHTGETWNDEKVWPHMDRHRAAVEAMPELTLSAVVARDSPNRKAAYREAAIRVHSHLSVVHLERKSAMPTIPTDLRSDPELGAVAVIFDAFPDDHRVWSHVNVRGRSIDFDAILANGTFSTSEWHLLRAAASLWKGEGHEMSLGRAANAMSNETLRVLLRVLAAYCRAPITWDSAPV